MRELINNYDREIHFSELEAAKKYFYPSEEVDKGARNPEDFLGEPEEFREFLKNWGEYKKGIANAETLEALADVLNEWTDIFGNGSMFTVKGE